MARDGMVIRANTQMMDRIIRDTPGAAQGWLNMHTEELVTDMKLSFNTSPPGREYKRGGRIHVASSPGYPPNIDTGTLINSIKWERDGTLQNRVMGAAHGEWLEDGTERMAARPFIGPAAFTRKQVIERETGAEIIGL